MTRASNGALWPVTFAARVSTNSQVWLTLTILVAFWLLREDCDLSALSCSWFRLAWSMPRPSLSAALIMLVNLLEMIV